jgi:hypothetical protein
LNASHETITLTTLPAGITKAHALALLHDPDKMIRMNPIIKTHHQLPASSSVAFFKHEPADRKPSGDEALPPVYSVTEDISGSAEGEEAGGTWRGGWAKRFVPDEISYETSLQCKEDGLVSITHAPMGVHSVTTWVVKEGEDGRVVLDERGLVTSNRMLMGFIKTTLQGSHDKLVKDFAAALEREVAEGEVEKVS